MLVDKNLLNVIKIVQRIGYQILVIDDSYFVVSEFIPADDQINFHTLVGIECTELLKNNATITLKDQSQDSKVEGIIKVLINTVQETQKFSKETQWRWFFSTK